MLLDTAQTGILACGMMLLMISGMFDLSIGGILAFSGIMAGLAAKSLGLPPILAFLVGWGWGVLLGAINGVVVTRFKINALIATLATYSNLNAASGYTQKTFDLSSYAGTTVALKFSGVEDSSLQTSFVVDDLAALLVIAIAAGGWVWSTRVAAAAVKVAPVLASTGTAAAAGAVLNASGYVTARRRATVSAMARNCDSSSTANSTGKIATPCSATDKRALFIMVNMQASPRFSSPSSQPRAPPPSP